MDWLLGNATGEMRGKKSWDLLKKGYLKKETKSTIIAAQDQAVSINSMRKVVFGENVSSLCGLFGMHDETYCDSVPKTISDSVPECNAWQCGKCYP